MIHNGVIFLYDIENKLVDGKTYKCPSMRRDIVLLWRSLYSVAFKHCFIQIAPSVDVKLVDAINGRNTNGKYQMAEKNPRKRSERYNK